MSAFIQTTRYIAGKAVQPCATNDLELRLSARLCKPSTILLPATAVKHMAEKRQSEMQMRLPVQTAA